MIETISGIATAFVIIVLVQLLAKYFTAKLLATTILVAIGFIYIGFSLQGNPIGSIILEIVVGLIFYFLAIMGFIRNNYLLAYGIMLHGLWDIFHHNGFLIGTHIPVYWPSFCFTIDIIDGLYFLIIFKRQNNYLAGT